MCMEATFSEPRLLVIDDDPAIVTFVSTALNEAGWHVSACTDPAEVCDQVANELPKRAFGKSGVRNTPDRMTHG